MYNITLIPGDGIGEEVSFSMKRVLDEIVEINWDIVEAGEKVLRKTGELVPAVVYKSIEKNKVVIKGPITTPIGTGFRSINVHLRKKYDLYANVRPIKHVDLDSVNMIIFRENTEGLYIGEETKIDKNTVEATKRITRKGSTRIIKKAFEYATLNHKDKVTVVHKANILKYTDGLFLDIAREISEEYPNIFLEEVIVDAMCMNMVLNPSKYDVIVTMNLYGDILSDLGAGLVGGLGLIPGANIGEDIAIFEAVHGSAPDIAGKGIANPIAMIRSAVMMLEYLKEIEKATCLTEAINQVLKEKKILTKDVGGNSSTNEITSEIIKKYKEVFNEKFLK